MAIPNISSHVTMSINTDSSAGKAVAGRLELNKKTKHVQLRYLYMQDIVQRGEMTISKIPTTDNPADVLTKHLPSTILTSHIERLHLQTSMTSAAGSILGVPTMTRLTIGMINVVTSLSTMNNNQQHQQLKQDLGYVCHKHNNSEDKEDAIRKKHQEGEDIKNNYLNDNQDSVQFNTVIQ
eukprot:2165007-Amphidinium_carterae.1